MASAVGGVRASVLLSRVRQLADMETAQSGSSQFVTDDEIKQRIDEAAGELYEKLITARGEDYFTEVDMIEVRSPPDALTPSFGTLPARFYRLRSLHFLTNAAAVEGGARPIFVKCEPYQRADMTHLLNAAPTSVGPFFYRLSALRGRADLGDNVAETSLRDRVEVWPQLAEDLKFRVAYIPWFATFDAAAETGAGSEQALVDPDPIYPGIMGWEEWVVIKVAIYCKDKEESDSSKLELRLAEQTARISGQAPRRDEGAPERVKLTRKRRKQGWYP